VRVDIVSCTLHRDTNGRFAVSNRPFTRLRAFDEVWFAGPLSGHSLLDHSVINVLMNF